jgi:hypothetical protein
MEDPLDKAQYYRDQAVNMRTLAANEDNQEARNALNSLAEIYVRLMLKFQGMSVRAPADNILRFKL